MTRLLGAVLALAVFVLVNSACSDGEAAPAKEETIVIHFSRFQSEPITVGVGDPLVLTLRNDDPIEHEWIVGDDTSHERHRTGTEPYHDSRPTEVTIPAFSTRITTVTFDEPGVYKYICHLPGHEQYGMVGELEVVDDSGDDR